MKHSNRKLLASSFELRHLIIHFETADKVKVHARNFDVLSVKVRVATFHRAVAVRCLNRLPCDGLWLADFGSTVCEGSNLQRTERLLAF
jgi:hypothetical protein